MDTSLARRRLHLLAFGGALLLVAAYAGVEARGGIAGVLGWDLFTGERVRVEVDASVGRTDAEQLTLDLTRAATGLEDFQVQQARHALTAMGIRGAAAMSDEEVLRRMRDAQMQAMRDFYGSDAASPPDGLIEIR